MKNLKLKLAVEMWFPRLAWGLERSSSAQKRSNQGDSSLGMVGLVTLVPFSIAGTIL